MSDLTVGADLSSAIGLDPKRAGDALLLKIALEGKGFQRARRELEAASRQTAEPAASSPDAPDPGSPAVAETRTVPDGSQALKVEIDRLSLMVQIESTPAITVATVSLTRTHLDQQEGRTPRPPPGKDPLVLDLDGLGPSTTGAEGAWAFDLADDGHTVPTSFVMGRTAFLALDRNGNGRIDNGGELFGDQHGAADGYEELAKFDSNGDARIDASDPVYSRLQLLFGDGSQVQLTSEGIRSITLDASLAGGTTSGGDEILRRAIADLAQGGTIGTYALGLNRFETTA